MTEMTPTLDRRDHCSACWEIIETKKADEKIHQLGPQRWCAACKSMHPAILFSQDQRKLWFTPTKSHHSRDLRRLAQSTICMLAQGHIRICKHKHISYREMCDWEATLAESELELTELPRILTPWECTECIPYFAKAIIQVSKAKSQEDGLEKLQKGSQVYAAKTRRWPLSMFRTSEPQVAGSSEPQEKRLEDHLVQIGPWKITLGHFVDILTRPPDGCEQPKLLIETGAALSDPEPRRRIVKTWTIPALECGENPEAEPYTIPFWRLRGVLSHLNDRYSSLMCAHMDFTDDALFDLLVQDTSVINSVWPEIERIDLYPRESSTYWPTATLRLPGIPSEEFKNSTRCTQPLRCVKCGAEYKWLKKGLHYFIEGRHDLSACFRSQHRPGNVNLGFIHAMNPDSYHHTRNLDLENVTWCSDSSCRNSKQASTYLQGVERALTATEGAPPPYQSGPHSNWPEQKSNQVSLRISGSERWASWFRQGPPNQRAQTDTRTNNGHPEKLCRMWAQMSQR